MYLLDTNIFLEILLGQNKQEECKEFILKNSGRCHLSDFTLYSIGIALFRKKLFKEYENFFSDITSLMSLRSLPLVKQPELASDAGKTNLDYDDAYQYATAKHYGLTIVTMDKDFKVIKDVDILFL